MSGVADVVPIDAPGPTDPTVGRSMAWRRIRGEYPIDPWGLDVEATALFAMVARLRWRVEVVGAERIPEVSPVLLVCNRRLGWAEPLVLTMALTRAVGRPVRPVGCPDVEPIGTVLRRFGALPSRADEIAGALRAGEMVALPVGRSIGRYQAGGVPMDLLEPAVEAGVTVIPVALTGHELGRRWSVRVGRPLTPPLESGPRSVAGFAVRAATELQQLLDEASTQSRWQRVQRVVPGPWNRSK